MDKILELTQIELCDVSGGICISINLGIGRFDSCSSDKWHWAWE